MLASEDAGIDFDAQLAVVSADLPMACTPEQALEGIRLVMLANELTLRHVATQEAARGSGLVHSKPVTAFSPVAVTLDELGGAWQQGRVHLTLQSTWNNRKVGMCDAGAEMSFHFGQLIAHLCKTRKLRAGSVIGSGTVSNRGQESQGQTQWPKGYNCIAEKRAMELLQNGQTTTDYLRVGDTVEMDVTGRDGHSLFGAIAQEVVAPGGAQ
jgi:fumarylacetoacetate (FAA) hydrolase